MAGGTGGAGGAGGAGGTGGAFHAITILTDHSQRLGRTELFVQAASACRWQGQETHWQAQGDGLEGENLWENL